MKPLNKWQPQSVLISPKEVSESIEYANHMGWYFSPSPLNAAFVTMLAINKVINENPIDN